MRNPCDWAFLFISCDIFSKAFLGEQLAAWEVLPEGISEHLGGFCLGLSVSEALLLTTTLTHPGVSCPFLKLPLFLYTQSSHLYTWPLWSQWSLGRIFSMDSQFITICLCRTIYLSLPPFCVLICISFLITSLVGGWGAESPLLHRASCFQDQRGAIHKQKEVCFCYAISVSSYQEWQNW